MVGGNMVRIWIAAGLLLPLNYLNGQDITVDPADVVERANCAYFGPKHDRLAKNVESPNPPTARLKARSAVTDIVAAQLPPAPSGSRSFNYEKQADGNTIDHYLFEAMRTAGVT